MATPLKFPAGDKRDKASAVGQSRLEPARYPIRQPSHWLRNTLVLLGLAGAGLLVWQWSDLRERTLIGSAYAARVGCVCHLVSQRDLKSCEADLAIAPLDGVAGMVSLHADDKARTVTAGLPLLGSQTARFDARYGCRLDPWED